MTAGDAASSAPASADAAGRGATILRVSATIIGIGFALVGVLHLRALHGAALRFAVWFTMGALALDLLVVPLIGSVGAAGRRMVPAPAWPAVRTGLATAALLLAFAFPLVLGLGGDPRNPSLRPRPYGTALALAILVIAVGTAAVAVLRSRRARNRRPSLRSDPGPDAR